MLIYVRRLNSILFDCVNWFSKKLIIERTCWQKFYYAIFVDEKL